ncbi:MAG: hypothetical protein WCV99_18865, partial [Sterolibacterium sp.]
LPGQFQKDICYSAPNPVLRDRARPTNGSDRGKHDLTLVVGRHWDVSTKPMEFLCTPDLER